VRGVKRLTQPHHKRSSRGSHHLKGDGRMPASTHPLCFLSFKPRAVSLAVRNDAARRRDILSRVNIVKRIKIGGRWKMFSIPRNAKGNYDWNAMADGRYYVE
jgi:hypothetical protein